MENYGNSYQSYTVLLRDCLQHIKYITKDYEIPDDKKVKFLIDGFKAKNDETTIGKLSMANNKAIGVMATEFEKSVS